MLLTFTGHSYWVYSVDWSPDGTKIASGGRDKTVMVGMHFFGIQTFFLLFIVKNPHIQVWDVSSGSVIRVMGYTDEIISHLNNLTSLVQGSIART